MASDYPGTGIDSFPRPVGGVDGLDSPDQAQLANDHSDAIEALQTKLGTGASTAADAVDGKVMRSNGDGTTGWDFGSRTDLVTAMPNPLYIAHRGGPNLYPEHSMEGYRAAAAAGFPIEVDLQTLSDGTLVPCHDSTVDRTTDGTGAVNTFDLAGWKALRIQPRFDGGRESIPPTWDEVLAEFGGRSLIVVENKGVTNSVLIDSIASRGLHRSVILQSFTYSHVTDAADAGIASMFLSDGATPATLDADGVEFLGCSTAVNSSYVSGFESLGIGVFIYTVSTRASAAIELAKGGSGLFSDDPWWISEHLVGERRDPFAERRWWTGGFKRGVDADYAGAVLPSPNEFGWNDTNQRYIAQGWAGEIDATVDVTIDLHVRFGATASAQTSWLGLYVGTFGDEDGAYNDAATSGQRGYHWLVRRNGTLQTYRVDDSSAASSIGSVAGTTIAATGQPGEADIRIEITSTGVTITNLTTGDTSTIADTTHREASRLSFAHSGAEVYLSEVRIREAV